MRSSAVPEKNSIFLSAAFSVSYAFNASCGKNLITDSRHAMPSLSENQQALHQRLDRTQKGISETAASSGRAFYSALPAMP
jgi:hypothetical protein